MYHLSFLILMVAIDGGLSSAISQRPLLVVLYIDYNQTIIYLKLHFPPLSLFIGPYFPCVRNHCSRPLSTNLPRRYDVPSDISATPVGMTKAAKFSEIFMVLNDSHLS